MKRNVCIVTSALVPSKAPLSYTKVRSAFTVEERFEQTKLTIESIRDYLPNSYIVLLDATPVPKAWKEYLVANVELFIDASKDVELKNLSLKCQYKGVAESTQKLRMLEQVERLAVEEGLEIENIFKISGRYRFNKSFEYDYFMRGDAANKAVFKPVPPWCFFYERQPTYYTFAYKVPFSMLAKFKYVLNESIKRMNTGKSMEIILPFVFSPSERHDIKSIGVEGFVAPTKQHFVEFDWEVYLAFNRDLLMANLRSPKLLLDHFNKYHRDEPHRVHTSNKPRVLCISHCFSGGTYFYFEFLSKCAELQDAIVLYYNTKVQLETADLTRVSVVHVFSVHGTNIDRMYLDAFLTKARAMGIKVYVTFHDFQWVLPAKPNMVLSELRTSEVAAANVPLLIKLANHAERIFVPSQYTHDNYVSITANAPELLAVLREKMMVVDNPDFENVHDNLVVPPLVDVDSSSCINIAFMGSLFISFKGSDHFLAVMKLLSNRYKGKMINYHIFGDPCNNRAYRTNFFFKRCQNHGRFEEDKLIKLLHDTNIHVVCLLGEWGETYGYCMSRIISSGLPIVYRNVGSFKTRLDPSAHERFFPLEELASPSTMVETFKKAICFVISNNGIFDYRDPHGVPLLSAGYVNADYIKHVYNKGA
jgi:hypothetical protein